MGISEQLIEGRVEDIYALGFLQPLLDGPYLPFTNSALRPLCLAYILNDITVNSRKTILEFGSGLSTIMIARLIRKNNTGSRLLSVEHDREWAGVIRASLHQEGLEDAVSILDAPLQSSSFAVDSNLWYGLDAGSGVFAGASFDMVIIDGPPAYEAAKAMSRYPALPFVHDLLAARSAVFLDDADREGEKAIIRRWENEYGIRFSIAGGSLAYAFRGDNFNVNIF
jgi:predicted O-methyltransferase YrrM